MEKIASDTVMAEAYQWLCLARIDYSANADIWDLRKNWSFIIAAIATPVIGGSSFDSHPANTIPFCR